jgi:hypothetical protein
MGKLQSKDGAFARRGVCVFFMGSQTPFSASIPPFRLDATKRV